MEPRYDLLDIFFSVNHYPRLFIGTAVKIITLIYLEQYTLPSYLSPNHHYDPMIKSEDFNWLYLVLRR